MRGHAGPDNIHTTFSQYSVYPVSTARFIFCIKVRQKIIWIFNETSF